MRWIFLILLSLYAVQAEATIFYTAKTSSGGGTASDSNTCVQAQSTVNPKLTIAGGLSCLSAGHTLQVRAGTYVEGLDNSIPPGTSWAAPVTLQNYPGETPIVAPSGGAVRCLSLYGAAKKYIIWDGLTCDGTNAQQNGMKITYASTFPATSATFIRITNALIKNSYYDGILISDGSSNCELINIETTTNGRSGTLGHGVYVQGANTLLENSYMHDERKIGTQYYSDNGGVNNGTIRNNRFYNNGTAQVANGRLNLFIGAGSGTVAYNNLVWAGNVQGIKVDYGASGVKLYNNVVYGHQQEGLNITSGSNGAVVQNNIVYSNAVNTTNNGTATSFTTNACPATGPLCDPNLVAAASPFVSASTASSADFHLNANAGNKARGGGTNLYSIFTTDFAGTARQVTGSWDAGAYRASAAVDTITLLSPNGGEQGIVKNTAYTVTWSTTGTVGALDIKYSSNSGSTYLTTLVAGTTNDGSQSVTMPNAATTTARIQICNAGATICDASSFDFTVLDSAGGGSLTKIISTNTTGTYIGDITGVSDSTILQQAPTTPNGTTGSNVGTLFATKYAANDHAHSLIRFDGIAQIPTAATLTSVTLGFYQHLGGDGSQTYTIDVRRLLRNWVESEATWNLYSAGNVWNTAGGLGAASDRTATAVATIGPIPVQTYNWYSVTQTSGGLFDLVQGWISGSIANQGLHLELQGAGTAGVYSYLHSSNASDNAKRPYLSLTYSTVTSTITLTSPPAGSHVFPGDSIPIRWQSSGISGDVQILMSRDGGNDYETLSEAYPNNQSDFVWNVTNGKATSNAFFKVVKGSVFGISPPVRIGGKYRH